MDMECTQIAYKFYIIKHRLHKECTQIIQDMHKNCTKIWQIANMISNGFHTDCTPFAPQFHRLQGLIDEHIESSHFDRLTNWLINLWVIEWITDLQADWLNEWLTYWLINWLTYQNIYRLTEWLNNSLTDWQVGGLIN